MIPLRNIIHHIDVFLHLHRKKLRDDRTDIRVIPVKMPLGSIYFRKILYFIFDVFYVSLVDNQGLVLRIAALDQVPVLIIVGCRYGLIISFIIDLLFI